jgi:response regulator of citrate/malate metabolism
MQKPPVLIIDPDLALQEILGEILKNRFRIFVANSIAESQSIMQGEDPHLIFIELFCREKMQLNSLNARNAASLTRNLLSSPTTLRLKML